ncbi:hypothetical protein EV426DRAFT_575356 [Tirmania nivea]|nr:hypothetical protein EV426DRAFT_575356 [Tirmania nivea]
MDVYKSKNIHQLGAKRKYELSPSQREFDYRDTISGPYREGPSAFAPSGFGSTGNNKRLDRYVSRDVASSHTGVRQHDQFKHEKHIPTGPRSQRERTYRPPYQSVGAGSRPHPSAGPEGIQRASNLSETINAPEGTKELLKTCNSAEKSKNSHVNNSPTRNQKAFGSVRGLESQEEYRKKSMGHSKQGYRDLKGIRKEKFGENHQIEFAKRDEFSPIESISTADDERNREFISKKFSPRSVAERSNFSESDVAKASDITPTAPFTVIGYEPATNGGSLVSTESNTSNLAAVTANDKIPTVLIDHTCLPAPVPQAIHSQLLETKVDTPQVPSLHLQPAPTPISSTNFVTAPEDYFPSFQPQIARKDSPMSTSAMSISSGSSPVHSPACNSPKTSLHTFSPSRCSISSSSRGKASTCILCKGPAAPPLKALVRCIECRHSYHTHCHTPRITITNGKFDVDVTLWVCSRCNKTQRASPTRGPHSVKRAVAAATPNHDSGSTSPTCKRRKLGPESPVCNGEIVSGCNQGTHGTLTARVSRSSNVVSDRTYGQAISERPRLDQLYKGTRPRKLLMSETQIGNSQEALQNLPPNTVCLQTQDILMSGSTTDSQANPFEIEETHHPAPLSIDFSSKEPTETKYTKSTAKNIDDLDDVDVPMDLESPRSPQYHSPEPQQQVTPADSNINHESMAVLQVSEASAQSEVTAKSFDHSRANNTDPVGSEGTEEDIDSPPYSPRLDDELPDSPATDITVTTPATNAKLPVTGATTQTAPVTPSLLLQQLAMHQDLQTPSLLSSPSPLVIPSAVSPLQTLLSLVPFPCVNCGVLWPISPQADNHLPVVREPIKEHRPLHTPSKEYRSPSLGIQSRRHFERDSSSSSFTKNARSAEKRKASPRQPEVIDQPVEKIITAQQLMEERYKKQPEIFPTNSRFPPNKEIEQSSEERAPTITSIKDRSDGKDGPKRKLTVSEYALRKKEKEKGFLKKDSNTSSPQGNVSQQEAEDMYNLETPEVVAPMDDVRKPIPEPMEAASLDALITPAPQTAGTEIVSPGDTEALHQLEKEIEQWKEKFEQQRRFVGNYVKHNAKIMSKLTSTEQEKLILEKKAAALEAEITTHRKKQEQLKEENEKLRQQRLQQDEEDLQGRLSDELEAAEARAKAMCQASQGHTEKNAPDEEDQGFLMKNVYKNLTFDIIDPLRDIAGELFNVPDKAATIPKPRYSATRKAEVLNFNYTNLRSLHLHREVDRTSDSNINGHASSSSSSPFSCVGATHSDKSRRSVTSGESSDGKTISFEKFARIPPNMVPVLKEGVLAFRAGQLNPRTRRLDRSVNCYKVGRDVPGELRGIR